MYLCLCVPTESTKIKPSQILVIPQHIASVFRLEVVTQTKKNSNNELTSFKKFPLVWLPSTLLSVGPSLTLFDEVLMESSQSKKKIPLTNTITCISNLKYMYEQTK